MTENENLLKRLRGIECELSPENLYCDGERSPAVARRREVILNRQKRAIISQLGYEPTMSELYPRP